MSCPDTEANLSVHRKGGGHHGGTGYPMSRLVALVACGTRTLLAAKFGPTARGETRYAAELTEAMSEKMIVLGDRNFAAANLITAIADTGADVLIRDKNQRKLPVRVRYVDGSYLSRIGSVEVRVIKASINITTADGQRSQHYQLITTILDPHTPAAEIVRLYHDRWEIETAYCELKQTILGGRVLRSRTPDGLEQEIYALLITYQSLRTAICDATLHNPEIDPDRGSFTVALGAARDQLIKAAAVIAETTIDLVGVIGQHVLNNLLPKRRSRTGFRIPGLVVYQGLSASAQEHQCGRNRLHRSLACGRGCRGRQGSRRNRTPGIASVSEVPFILGHVLRVVRFQRCLLRIADLGAAVPV